MKSKTIRNIREQAQINRRYDYNKGVDYTRIGRDPKQILLTEVNTMGQEWFCELCRKTLPTAESLRDVRIGAKLIGRTCLTCSSALDTLLSKQFSDADAAYRAALQAPPGSPAPGAPSAEAPAAPPPAEPAAPPPPPAAPPPPELKPVDAPGATPPPLPPK